MSDTADLEPEIDEDDEPELDVARLELRSADMVERRAKELAALYPEAVRDGKLHIEALSTALGDVVDDGPESFGLSWPGKADAIRMAQRPSDGTLVPMKEESVEWDTTKNVIIEGENLEVLKVVQRSYHGKVTLIYIDPPYNTGKDFVYRDNFRDPLGAYLKYSGQAGEDGARLRANLETGGRYHSAWLSMMWPRLHLARSLLKDEGLIAVSIDDHEVHHLRQLLNEIFGEENFIATVVWHKMDSPKNSARHLSEDHEYLVLYARDAARWRPNLVGRSEEMIARYKNPDSDPRGPWLLSDLAARNPYAEGKYAITTPSGRMIGGPPPGSYWRISRARFDELDADGRIWWGTGDVRPGIKRFLSEVRDGVVPQTYWNWKSVGSTRNAKQEFHKLLGAGSGDDLFVTPKPTGLLERVLEIATNEDSIVVDFFAGSGTLGDAVFRANAADSGRRRFVLAQLPERTGDDTYGDLAALARARVSAAGRAVEAAGTDLGYRAYRLTQSALTERPREIGEGALTLDVESHPISADRDDDALLTEVLLARGFDLVTPLEWREITGVPAARVAGGAVLASFTRSLTLEQFETLVAQEPAQLILLEAAFAGNDEIKVNALQHLKTTNAHRDTPIELLLL